MGTTTRSLNLEATHPHLAKQWHPRLNGALRASQVSADSAVVVWWLCEVAPHLWQASVRTRASDGTGCAICGAGRDKLLRDHRPDLAREWHAEKNWPRTLEHVGIECVDRLWWRCKADPSHEWFADLPSRLRRPSCPLCTGRLLTPATSLAGRFPELAREWHPTKNGALSPETTRPHSGQRVHWQCATNPAHEWEATVDSRTRSPKGCPTCAALAPSPEVSLAARCPSVASRWHPTKNGALTPDLVKADAPTAVWWQCPIDPTHEWRAYPSSRGHCPKCSPKHAPAAPRTFWRCPRDPEHSWEAPIDGGPPGPCPHCAGRATAPTTLAALHPEVASEWHPERNGPLTPDAVLPVAMTPVWWRCGVNPDHEWLAAVRLRTMRGTGCPACALAKRGSSRAENGARRARRTG